MNKGITFGVMKGGALLKDSCSPQAARAAGIVQGQVKATFVSVQGSEQVTPRVWAALLNIGDLGSGTGFSLGQVSSVCPLRNNRRN